MNILITGGGCREAIDGVRCVTNMSTGRTSACLADYFAEKGHSVTEIIAEAAVRPSNKNIRLIPFTSGFSLGQALIEELSARPYDAVIHAAAVSDFIPDEIIVDGTTYKAGENIGKLHSGSSMTVTFRAAPKILDSISTWAKDSGSEPVIFSFKLTNGSNEAGRMEAVSKIFKRKAARYVVSNDLTEITSGGTVHPFVILEAASETDTTPAERKKGSNTTEMAQAIESLISGEK